jgi:hypothetical protein
MTVLSYTPQADALYRQWRHQRIRVGTHDLRIAAVFWIVFIPTGTTSTKLLAMA